MAREQVSSIVKALQILECFIDADREWTLKMLVEELSLPSTTVFRQISTLTERQYLVQDPVRKSYRIGPRLLQLSGAVLGQSDLRRMARPELEHLSETVRETINLSTLLDRDIFYLDKVETHRSIVCNTRVGSRAPAYATSAGKAILAFQSDAYIEDYCRWMVQNASPLTERTIIIPDRLREELTLVRQNGYAVDDGEIEKGLICLGAPIYDVNRKVAGAVSISGPDFRMRADWDLMLREIRSTARNISHLLGWTD